MSEIHICSLKMVEALAAAIKPSHVLSLLGGITPFPDTPKGVDPRNHLKITLADIAEPQEGMTTPAVEHMQSVIAFARHWQQTGATQTGTTRAGTMRPMLVHCFAGISRSTASALTVACTLRPNTPESVFTMALRLASESAQPNSLMIAYSDHLLGRQGRLINAVEDMSLADFSKAGTPFILPLDP